MTAHEAPEVRRLRHPAAHRLRSGSEIQRVYREGNRARGTSMTVVARANDVGATRLCLSVGKAAWKRAVKRNRVRRIFREAFRLEHAALPAGVDLILIAAQRTWPDLATARSELVHLAHKAWRRYCEKVAAAATAEVPPEPPDGAPRP